MIYDITPCPKPRQTRADRWKKRPCVLRYRAFADQVRASGMTIPDHGAHVTFYVAMPQSWPNLKRREMADTAHQQRPDVDNFEKALLDALFQDDSHVWDIRTTKRWSYAGLIKVEVDDAK